MGAVVERIALSKACEGAQSWRELLVVGLVSSSIWRRFFCCRSFGSALAAVEGLICLVVGIGIVVFSHSPATMTASPATLQFPISPHTIADQSNTLSRSGLVQQDAALKQQSRDCGSEARPLKQLRKRELEADVEVSELGVAGGDFVEAHFVDDRF